MNEKVGHGQPEKEAREPSETVPSEFAAGSGLDALKRHLEKSSSALEIGPETVREFLPELDKLIADASRCSDYFFEIRRGARPRGEATDAIIDRLAGLL